MISCNDVVFTSKELREFKRYQKKIFLSKADSPFIGKIVTPRPTCEDINNIFYLWFEKKVDFISKFDRSTLHQVYKVMIGKKFYILRVNNYSKYYKELNFHNDLFASRVIKNTAKVYVIDTDRKHFPFDYEITNFLDGESVYDLYRTKGTNGISPLVTLIGSTLAKVHKIKAQNYGPLDVDRLARGKEVCGIFDTWREFILVNLDEELSICTANKIILKKMADQIYKVLTRNVSKVSNFSPRFLHGDVANHNSIYNKKKGVYFIDWEDSMAGDPIYDIAYYATGVYKNEVLIESFFSGYKKISAFPKDFDLRYFLYFLRVSVAKAVIRYKMGTIELKGSPDVSERIKYSLGKLKGLNIC